MITRNYKCKECGQEDETTGLDAPIPYCCKHPMDRQYHTTNLNMRKGTKKGWK